MWMPTIFPFSPSQIILIRLRSLRPASTVFIGRNSLNPNFASLSCTAEATVHSKSGGSGGDFLQAASVAALRCWKLCSRRASSSGDTTSSSVANGFAKRPRPPFTSTCFFAAS